MRSSVRRKELRRNEASDEKTRDQRVRQIRLNNGIGTWTSENATFQQPLVLKVGRLVSSACLEGMHIFGGSASLLLDHQLIPVGTCLEVEVGLPSSLNKDQSSSSITSGTSPTSPRSNCTVAEWTHTCSSAGRTGKSPWLPELPGLTRFALCLNLEQLRIDYGDSPSNDLPYQALPPMKHLRTLTLYCFPSPRIFVHALHPT